MSGDLIKNGFCFSYLACLAEGVHQNVESCHLGRESGGENLGEKIPGESGRVRLEDVVEEAGAGIERQGKTVLDSEADALDGIGHVPGAGVLEGESADEGGGGKGRGGD